MTESRTFNWKNLSVFSPDLPVHRIFKDLGIESYRFFFLLLRSLSIGEDFLCAKGGWME